MAKGQVENVTKWDRIKAFINDWPCKGIFRQDLIKGLILDGSPRLSKELMDTYRLYLMEAGYIAYLKHPKSGRPWAGKYTKVKLIPMSLTLDECLDLAYPHSRKRK